MRSGLWLRQSHSTTLASAPQERICWPSWLMRTHLQEVQGHHGEGQLTVATQEHGFAGQGVPTLAANVHTRVQGAGQHWPQIALESTIDGEDEHGFAAQGVLAISGSCTHTYVQLWHHGISSGMQHEGLDRLHHEDG
eukprot:1160142-Pelagomonas_calceolata.AAC.22